MIYEKRKNDIVLRSFECLNLKNTLLCGQAFRWKETEKDTFRGTVKGYTLCIEQKDDEIIFKNTSEDIFSELWVPYFDLERDYKAITDGFRSDRYISAALDEFYGIRILHQEPWEALCSFIISQNNNIPRICGIIERLCESFGTPAEGGDFSFPDAKTMSCLTETDLSVLRAGFRNKYLIDAAKKIATGEISLDSIYEMPIEDARTELMKIKGVGPKVAECTLLYGFGRLDAFPVDVWVKRIMAEMYADGLPECTKSYEGIAQQYLFHWRRNSREFKGE